MSVKITASKLSLYIRPSGGCHACDNPTETRIVSCDWASLYSFRKLPAQVFNIPGSCRIPHAQPDYVDAILANFAPEKTPEHPRAACAINSQISASLWLDQSALSAMYDMNNLPTHPKQLHIPTCMDCCFKEAFANRTHIVFNNSSLS